MAELLDAAACVIAASGYEAATMSAIAEQAGAPIGSLYQFFPNKESITHALRTEYGKDFEALLISLESSAKSLRLQQLVQRLIVSSVRFVESHPAFLQLLDAPSSTRSPLALRQTLRERLASCLAAVQPRLSKNKAMRLAAVTLQMVKGLNQLYAEASEPHRRQFVTEYRIALTSYLTVQLEPVAPRGAI